MIRAAIGFVLSLALCAALMPFVISVLGKHRAAQPILGYVESHKAKSGTPTMGGVGFLVSAALPFAFLLRGDPSTALVCLIVAVGYGAIGLTDDIMKVKSGHNKGLSAGWKLLLQFLVACAVSAYAVFGSPVGTTILAPFTDKPLDLSWFALPYYVFVFLAFTYSVNLTDGLDGLAASVTEVFLMCFAAVLIICAGFAPTDTQLNELLLIACFAGALAGFLCYNRYPARVFMGDTGSLSLGGLLASLSVLTGLGLSAAIIGVMYVLGSLSVIVQVISFKLTKKRVLLMSPLHHHFERKGIHENRIVGAYVAVTAAAGVVTAALTLFLSSYIRFAVHTM